jgi:YfiH family protein
MIRGVGYRPAWPVAPSVHALITTRAGGVSRGPFDAPGGGGGLNLGIAAGDSPAAVRANRERLRAHLPADPRWLKQVHGATVVCADDVAQPVEADASFTTQPGTVCAVLVADCMPVLLADSAGRGVAIAHAGWRGLAAGLVQRTAQALRVALGDRGAELVAYLGPAIGPDHFVVGAEVLEAMTRSLSRAADAFRPAGDKYYADLFLLGRQALAQVHVTRVYGGGDCTYADPERFYSYRRDRVTGRQAGLVWLGPG